MAKRRDKVVELRWLAVTARDGDWEFYEAELSTICAISTYSIVGATP